MLEGNGRMTDYKAERDTLIEDIAKLRAERDEYKRKLDEVLKNGED